MENYCRTALALLCILSFSAFAQPSKQRMSKEEYIERFQQDALEDMKRTGVPASIKLAQGILESDCGNSRLAIEANNHFGIKCHKEWNGDTFYQDDDEKNECFRKYNSVLESYDDHSYFLRSRERYAFLFDLDITDYKGWAHGLKKAGYATNPNYAHQLIKIIEDYDLNRLDKTGKKIPVVSASSKTVSTKDASTLKSFSLPPAATNTINNTPYVIARKGDSYYSIAAANNMALWQVLKYNDAGKDDIPAEGEVVFIKPKRNKAQKEFHIVSSGETLRGISQLYGIKLKKIYKYNHLSMADKIKPGDRLRLR